jgi:polar amino acid transport system substrate-binding protein
MTTRDEVRAELCPTGRLRVAVAVGPAVSAMWCTRDTATGEPRGVTAELGRLLAEALGAELQLVVYPSSGAIVAASANAEWDVAFAPVDAERKQKVAFGNDYFVGESTCMVHRTSPAKRLADADRPGLRIVGVENTATIRSLHRFMRAATVIGVSTLDEALEALRSGSAEAVALGRESLESVAERAPEYRILEDAFHRTGTAIAVQQGKPAALAYASEFVEGAKRDGTVRRLFDAHGMTRAAVAPPGSRSEAGA